MNSQPATTAVHPAPPVKMYDIYRFLAGCIEYPEAGWMTQPHLQTLYLLLDELGWQENATAIKRAFSDPDTALSTLQIEYTRLFINAIPHVVAPPYASVYLSAEGMIYGASTERTKAFYRRHGFDLASEATIPDYLPCELTFLALLAQEGKSLEEEDFLKTLFRPWFKMFRQRLVEGSQHPFYLTMVDLIDFFTS